MEINNYFLPEEISINILSRLPAASVLRCVLVRKSWQSLIVYNHEFARMHLLRGLGSHHGAYSNGRVNFLLLVNLGYEKGYTLHYTLDDDDDDNYDKAIPTFRALSSNPNPYNNNNYYVVGSCNGLICMAYDTESDTYRYEAYEQPIYICNPITREWLALPSLINVLNESYFRWTDNIDPIRVSNCITVVCGFGYLPSTNEYKVVRIYYCDDEQPFVGRVQVYTLGAGTGWRDKGEITYSLQYQCTSPSIPANGALHWLDDHNGKIVAFNLADEEFLLLPTPPCFLFEHEDKYPFQIQVLGGQLCAVHCKDNSTVDVWSLKNKNKEKNVNYNKDVNGHSEYQFCSWIKEFDIGLDLEADLNPSPFILTKHGDNVLYNRRATLFCYEFETATSKVFVDIEDYLSASFYSLEAIPHLNSFISLKALIDKDSKIIESAN